MVRPLPFVLTIALFCIHVSASPSTQPAGLRVPARFSVERVASPPLVERPMMACFDERGRLFVTESAGVNLGFDALKESPPHSIRMLEDSDSDGIFDKATTFADRMTFPAGVLCHEGAVYVASAPSIWKLEDTDNDGVCDRRRKIVTGFGSTGNGADLHGPFLGPDGWLYFTDGRNGHDVTLGDGSHWKGKAAAVYRCRTDGSGLEVVFGGGMDNPVECVFTPEGELLVSCNLVMARPQRLDGILFGIDGGVYPHDAALQEFRQTGELLKPVGDLGWVAISGITRWTGPAFAAEFDGNLFSAQFNPHRVQRHVVARDGAGFKIASHEFLTSTSTNFHPTDVLQDPDGSLLVIDTGGWFRIGCPASEVSKPDVLGGIYRVRHVNGDGAAATRLADVAAIDALWAGVRNKELQPIREALRSRSPRVRQTALRCVGLLRDAQPLHVIIESLADADLAVAREAAFALGRIRSNEATQSLLIQLNRSSDRFYEHAIVHALIETADRDGTSRGLTDAKSAVRRGALIALDQMSNADLQSAEVFPLLRTNDASLRAEAIAVIVRHSDWSDRVADEVSSMLAKSDADPHAIAAAMTLIEQFAPNVKVQDAVAALLHRSSTPAPIRLAILSAMRDAKVDPLPATWLKAVGIALRQDHPDDDALVRSAVDVVAARGLSTFDRELSEIARSTKYDVSLRIAAIASRRKREPLTEAEVRFLIRQFEEDANASVVTRLAVARALVGAALSDHQRLELIDRVIPRARPLDASAMLPAFEGGSDEVGLALARALVASRASATIPVDLLRSVFATYSDTVRAAATPLLKRTAGSAEQRTKHLDEMQASLPPGDPSRGQAVFLSKTATCTTCHAVAGMGADVGPDLSKIGAIRSSRDLLESVLYPSATIARGFEPYVVETKDNNVFAGTLVSESSQSIRLKTPAEVTIPRAQVKVLRGDRVSIMPQGLEAQLSTQELSDLIAFLSACK